MLNLAAYALRDLQHCRDIHAMAASAGISLVDLDLAIAKEIADRTITLQSQPVQQRPKKETACPSCGKGIAVERYQGGVKYIACMNPTTKKVGCGWSRRVS